ncbi:peroxidase [Lunatimonas salinarum]|uniref:peroxidase n=1 Tax=Lunatimonas salinarum TaxID=1774590 RepID=UPI001FD7EE25|nr:peroxidase [Lunatimonas salinarum]
MSRIHRGLTVTVKIAEEQIDAASLLLEQLNRELRESKSIYQKEIPSVLFLSWLVLPTQVYAGEERLPARILLMTSYVGNHKNHLRELARCFSTKMQQVFSLSDEFPADANVDLVAFLRKKSIPNTFYAGFKFVATQDIDQEAQLKEEVFNHLTNRSRAVDLASRSPSEMKQLIEDFVKDHPKLQWARQGIPGVRWDRIRMLFPLGLFVLLMSSSLISLILRFFMDGMVLDILVWFFPVFVAAMLILFLLLRLNELNPHIPGTAASDERVRDIVTRETNPVINEMTVIAPLKKGWIRRVFLAVSLRLVFLIRYFSYIPTVHTARWLQTDNGKRLVFIATFDNISEAYAHDFVDSERRTMNMAVIFSHAFGFPATRWLVHKQYNHRSEYMKGVRAHQQITQCWYAYNEGLSVENLKNNRAFREGLFKEMKDDEIREWLLRI